MELEQLWCNSANLDLFKAISQHTITVIHSNKCFISEMTGRQHKMSFKFEFKLTMYLDNDTETKL